MTRFIILNSKVLLAVSSMIFILLIGCQGDHLSTPKDYTIICYAATYGKGIYKSDNGGTSWFPLDFDQKTIHAYFKRLYKRPHDEDLLYITTTGAGLFKLNLQTGSLNRVNGLKGEKVNSLAFRDTGSDEQGHNEVIAGITKGGVLKTSNQVVSWVPCNTGLIYHDVNVLFAHGKDLYAGTVKDLFKWNENSKQWIPASNGIKNKNVISIDVNPQGKILYAGSGTYEDKKSFFEEIPCVYKSEDSGSTWNASDNGIPNGTLIYVIAINPKRAERIYLGTSDGIYRSIDGGQNWIKMEKGLSKDLRVFDIKIDRMSDGKDVVYAASSRGVYMSTDDEETFWVNKSYGLEPTVITSIILLPEKLIKQIN